VAWRTGIVLNAQAHKRLLFGIATIALVVGASFSVAARAEAQSGAPWPLLAERLAPVLMAVGYAAIVLGVMATGAQRVFAWAAPIGRMALTNYLLQSIILGWIFYGYGLGL